MKIPDISQFRLPEAFNDSKGKTNALLIAGLYGTVITGLCILITFTTPVFIKDDGLRSYFTSNMVQLISAFGLSLSALGVHHLGKDKELTDSDPDTGENSKK